MILLFSLLVWLQLAKRKTLNLPPSPPKLPLIGNIHQVGKLLHHSLRDLSKKYGSLLLLQLGYNSNNHDIVFSDRSRTTAANIFFYKCKDMACAPYGEYWRQVKKMSIVQLFSRQSVQSFQFIRDEEVELLINKIRSDCLKESLLSNRHSYSQKLLILFTSLCVGDMFPYLRWVDVLTGLIPSMKTISAELDAFLDQDFLSIIMQLQKNGTFEMDLTQENIKAYWTYMFVAGIDSSTTTKVWMMAELLKHPNAMKKVQEEVRNVVGNKLKVDAEDVKTLRLHPAGPLLLPRQTSASVKFGGYDIPSNTTVLINAWAIQRDPKWFENSSIDFKGQDFQLNPFGFGRRRCPGIAFGVASIEFVMANLLYWFDWKLPAGETAENMDMAELYGLTVTKKTPLHVLPISHFSL
ncbi:hypothetical protein ES332_A10G238600v1 [Gossypium tomentosum]|uniref:Cytochrome P450 n=1 Tax=Gossypium tomentosum TaxID=34277 RepID=A0A5D2NUB9_GOSTO|nr:hypothetical protein ES332_A10G238600v1 [Gossypium tomentosum]